MSRKYSFLQRRVTSKVGRRSHLGAQWIPRKKLAEAQVLVGQRVWYPLLRAYRSMRSRQSLLDCSLTQLYRVAERYRY